MSTGKNIYLPAIFQESAAQEESHKCSQSRCHSHRDKAAQYLL